MKAEENPNQLDRNPVHQNVQIKHKLDTFLKCLYSLAIEDVYPKKKSINLIKPITAASHFSISVGCKTRKSC